MHAQSLQSQLTLCDPMNYSLPVSLSMEFSRKEILEQVAISFSREFSQPRDWTCVFVSPALAGRFSPAPPEYIFLKSPSQEFSLTWALEVGLALFFGTLVRWRHCYLPSHHPAALLKLTLKGPFPLNPLFPFLGNSSEVSSLADIPLGKMTDYSLFFVK